MELRRRHRILQHIGPADRVEVGTIADAQEQAILDDPAVYSDEARLDAMTILLNEAFGKDAGDSVHLPRARIRLLAVCIYHENHRLAAGCRLPPRR